MKVLTAPAASGDVLIACGANVDDRSARRGDSMGVGPMLHEHRRDVMLQGNDGDQMRRWNW